jgi:hypothetical protein
MHARRNEIATPEKLLKLQAEVHTKPAALFSWILGNSTANCELKTANFTMVPKSQ